MTLPWTDWQFWLVTAAAGWGVWIVVRPFLPRREDEEAPCANCAVGTAARAALERREAAAGGTRPNGGPRPTGDG